MMVQRNFALVLGIGLLGSSVGLGQALPTSATIESVPLDPTMPDRYQVTAVLEPVRKISLVAPSDGTIRSLETPVGMKVRATQEIGQLDRTEAAARVKAALADVKEKQALLKGNPKYAEIYGAQLEGAQARAELEQIALDRLTLRAPFAGRVVSVPVSSGQFVLKGTVIAELADVTSFRAFVPVDRRTATEGGELRVYVEEQETTAKVQSVLPLPESYESLKELAAPFAAAWITVPNPKAELAAGMRIRSETLPTTPIAAVARDAVKSSDPTNATAQATVQVIRNEYVSNVPVRVLGKLGADRLQVTGPFRASDALIVSSSVPLLAGTLVRFSQGPAQGVEGTTPNPDRRGDSAGIVPPAAGTTSAPPASRPIPAATAPAPAARRPSQAPPQGSTPF